MKHYLNRKVMLIMLDGMYMLSGIYIEKYIHICTYKIMFHLCFVGEDLLKIGYFFLV